MQQVKVSGLYIYPIKSCRGIALSEVEVLATGFAQDRRWMLVNEQGMFVTQREVARMALIAPELHGDGLLVRAPAMPDLFVEGHSTAQPLTVTVWRDTTAAFDEGTAAAAWFSRFLDRPVRLVRFDDTQQRISSHDWTGEVTAFNQFADGFALLVLSTASLADLNARLPAALPMERFRPNLVVDDLSAYGEDEILELRGDSISLRLVKPCTRCKIVTIDQHSGVAQGTEPIATLMKYRRHPTLRGVTFGQNAIVLGNGRLAVDEVLQVTART